MALKYAKAVVKFHHPDRGGRVVVPVGDGYAPYVRTAGNPADLAVRVIGMPPNGVFDHEYEIELELSYHPKIDYSRLTRGTRFNLIEGPKVVGEGIIVSDF